MNGIQTAKDHLSDLICRCLFMRTFGSGFLFGLSASYHFKNDYLHRAKSIATDCKKSSSLFLPSPLQYILANGFGVPGGDQIRPFLSSFDAITKRHLSHCSSFSIHIPNYSIEQHVRLFQVSRRDRPTASSEELQPSLPLLPHPRPVVPRRNHRKASNGRIEAHHRHSPASWQGHQ